MKYFCCDPRRLDVVRRASTLNGIEYLEVLDHLEPSLDLRQRTLFVRLLRSGFNLTRDNVLIDGGERVAVVEIEWAAAAVSLPAGVPSSLVAGLDDPARVLVIRTFERGDFSTYTLRLRTNALNDDPPSGFDPRLSEIQFSFKVECPSDFDCAEVTACSPEVADSPTIDYLAKDFTGFRRLMLDRLQLVAPGFTERSAADVGVALVELLAYAADNLSYRQDATANEAYLATARRRVSVRRHARLVDYALHDGCNARAWVHIPLLPGVAAVALPKGTPLLTRVAGLTTEVTPASKEDRDARSSGALVFETAAEARLHPDLNKFSLYAWGDLGCCLPKGSTRATLRGDHPRLRVNDFVVFQEMVSPTTGKAEDADPSKRWAVRLLRVWKSVDPCGQIFDPQPQGGPPLSGPVDVTEIEWDASDALPFALCVSSTDRPPEEKISLVFGNIVLADHGRTIATEALPATPKSHLSRAIPPTARCQHEVQAPIPARYRPTLAHGPVTQGFDLERELLIAPDREDEWRSASSMLRRDPRPALPSGCELVSAVPGASPWRARRDLLSSSPTDTHFVVETENDGSSRLRFGDDERHGQRPNEETEFTARYRVGNGSIGNVGADTIAHIVTAMSGVFGSIRNPMAAAGGVDAEDLEAVRRDAPQAFRRQERAVTPHDYADAARRRPEVQRAAATFRWTGSWHTVFVTADRFGGGSIDGRFEKRLRRHLEPFRMAGYDLEVNGPRYVALDVTLHVCVKPGYFRSEVLRAVRTVLGSGVMPDGRLGAFHPDNFSFGDDVYLSPILSAAQAVEGVEAVWARRFERMSAPDPLSLANEVIPIGQMEIAQLANNPNFRERGRLTLEGGGGK